MIKASMENILQLLEKVPHIYYLFCFQKDPYKTRALIDLDNEVNAMTCVYVAKPGFKV